jgi:hypothetical protein
MQLQEYGASKFNIPVPTIARKMPISAFKRCFLNTTIKFSLLRCQWPLSCQARSHKTWNFVHIYWTNAFIFFLKIYVFPTHTNGSETTKFISFDTLNQYFKKRETGELRDPVKQINTAIHYDGTVNRSRLPENNVKRTIKDYMGYIV